MTRNATVSCSRARAPLAALGLALTLVPGGALAQDNVREREVGAREVAMTPLSDLNLARDPIPPILQWARANPYAADGTGDCAAIRSSLGDLDAVLGDDVDTQEVERRGLTPGGVAQRVVGMFIPFRGVIREVSGANEHEFNFREAITAGMMRRAYLKGLGEAKGCPYPARPMPPEMAARLGAAPEPGVADEESPAEDGTRFVSRPVIQGNE